MRRGIDRVSGDTGIPHIPHPEIKSKVRHIWLKNTVTSSLPRCLGLGLGLGRHPQSGPLFGRGLQDRGLGLCLGFVPIVGLQPCVRCACRQWY